MSEVATYALYVDWNNDGDYSDTGENISADMISANIQRGFSSPLGRYPAVGRMSVTLRNSAQTYSPPTTAAARPRRPVRLTMTYGGTTETLFEGLIDSIRPDFGTTRSRRAVLECVDHLALLDQFNGDIILGIAQRASDIIEDVVAAVYTPASTSYETGIHVFPIAADRWSGKIPPAIGGGTINGVSQEISASDKIQDACISDWGRFFIAADGTPTFYNRHHQPLYSTTDLTIDDTMINMGYQMSTSEIANYVEVTCHPRNIGQSYEVLGSVSRGASSIIEAGGSVIFDIAFSDPANNAVALGGLDVQTPVANTDFIVTDDEAGEGTDVTSDITPTLSASGDHAEVTLANGGANPAFVQLVQVRGYAVRTLEPVTLVAQDATSIAAYGKRTMAVDAILLNEEVSAQGLANYLLDYYKDPLHDVRNVEFYANKNATLMAAARDLELLQRFVITESQTGLSSVPMFVYALRHTIEPGQLHRVSVDLEQTYDVGTPFIIGSSLIGGAHVIIY